MLEDLIVAAINSAKKNADDGSASIMKNVAGDMKLPEGFKF
jgi:DNA-binding protein YbaB